MGVESPVVVAVEEVEVEEVLETVAGLEVKQSIELVCQAMYQAREAVTTSAALHGSNLEAPTMHKGHHLAQTAMQNSRRPVLRLTSRARAHIMRSWRG